MAASEKPVQAAMYPERKIHAGTTALSLGTRRRFTSANVSTIGAAEGTIIATIMMAHMANVIQK